MKLVAKLRILLATLDDEATHLVTACLQPIGGILPNDVFR